MSTDVEAMVKQGIRAYKAGKKEEARELWEKATELDQYNEQAWLWLSAVVESEDDQRTCLENVLFINPDNTSAKKGLAMLEAKTGGAPAAPSKPAKPAPAPEPEPPSLDDTYTPPPTATSSASSVFVPADEPTPDDYDDWVESLNLNKPEQETSSGGSGPFTSDVDFFDDDAFGGDVFAESESLAFTYTDTDEAFAEYEEEAFTPTTSAAYSYDDDDENDPFADPFAQGSSYDDGDSGPFSSPSLLDDEDDVFGDPFSSSSAFVEEEEAPPARKRGPASPVSQSSDSAIRSTDSFKAASAFGGTGASEQDPGEFFKLIPAGIKATRIPGTPERYPPLVLIGLIVLIVLNIGAVVLLVGQLAG